MAFPIDPSLCEGLAVTGPEQYGPPMTGNPAQHWYPFLQQTLHDQLSLPAAPMMQQSIPGPLPFSSGPAMRQPPPGQPQMSAIEQRQQVLEEYEQAYQQVKALRRSHHSVVDVLIPPDVYVSERMTGRRTAPLSANAFSMPEGMSEWPLGSARSHGRPVVAQRRKYTRRRKRAVKARNADADGEASLGSPSATPTEPLPAPQPVEEPQAHQGPVGTVLPNLAAPGILPGVSAGASVLESMTESEVAALFAPYLNS